MQEQNVKPKMSQTTKKRIIAACILVIFTAFVITGLFVKDAKALNNPEFVDANPTVYYFTKVDCVYCSKVRPSFIATKSRFMDRVNIMHFDMQDGDEGQELAKKYGVTAAPTIIFVDVNGNTKERQRGYNSTMSNSKWFSVRIEKYFDIV